MSVAVNRRTKELVGYWRGKNEAIVVTDYSIVDLTKKFNKAVAKRASIGRKNVESMIRKLNKTHR